MSKFALLVSILLANVLFARSTPRFTHIMNKREFFCGPKLTDALSLVCQGNYNSPNKKSVNDLLNYNEYEMFQNDANQVDFPFGQKDLGENFVAARLRRGIVDECCFRPCSYKHLTQYCA